MERKLAALMVADFVDSTGQMASDEEAAITRISDALSLVRDCVTRNGGRVFSTAGDALLAEFPSPVGALRSAIDARARLGGLPVPCHRKMRFGLHVADVVTDGSDLKGDGVNLAARIQSAADPGEIDVSEQLHAHVQRVSPCSFSDLGPQDLRGMPDPVRVFRVDSTVDRHVYQVAPTVAEPRQRIRPNSVAVLPFRTAGDEDDDQRFLSEGLTDDLVHELGQFRSLFVSSRTASHTLDGQDPIEIGKSLGVKFLLTGSLRKHGDRVRLNISLSETATGALVWSERIQSGFDEILVAMDELTARVAATVSGRIDNQETRASRVARPENMSAYEFYLRGLWHHRLSGIDQSHVNRAIDWFHKAQTADPNFARPFAMEVCAWSYRPDFDLRQAEMLLNRAMELDPADPELHRIFGVLMIKLHRDHDASRRHHERAMSLAPNDAYIIGRCAAFYSFVGEPERALDLLERAEALDPFLPVWIAEERICALYVQGRYDEVGAAARNLPFQTRRTRCYRAAARVAQGDEDRARAIIAEALTDDPSLSVEYVVSQELFSDAAVLDRLIGRLRHAGLPAPPQQGAVETAAAIN
ncbi:TolB amino-terminal domain-containing protein [Cribrihabitans marinus]|uniref:TolB amino-terminal domain-containing protein n=1 Tax=Cribrihabitans marinus TaxID=1227549 RepID=A0A1H7D450_9RHOB|nr:adenylate/guanylate cyclase domain-containing protein [Cribrihabitans marinus]GGH36726.1 adenylate cyclase [Cribrihabitans marinus]SEJ93890.1 TolB amino-terminal domain-containing protein [Cribrihabitans marinus]